MIARDAAWIAREAGGELVRGAEGSPSAAAIDSRGVPAGRAVRRAAPEPALDGGDARRAACRGGAWGALVAARHAEAALASPAQ